MVSLIVGDIATAHQTLLAAGGSHGLRICEDSIVPGRCLFSFVRDPNGNWIELVQFADLSGPPPAQLPPLYPGPDIPECQEFPLPCPPMARRARPHQLVSEKKRATMMA